MSIFDLISKNLSIPSKATSASITNKNNISVHILLE